MTTFCHNGLSQSCPVKDLISINLEPAHDLTEGQLRAQRLHLRHLGRKSERVALAGVNDELAGRQRRRDAEGEQVGV